MPVQKTKLPGYNTTEGTLAASINSQNFKSVGNSQGEFKETGPIILCGRHLGIDLGTLGKN